MMFVVRTVVVVPHPHVLGHVVDSVVHECDPTLFELVGELELVEDLKLIHRFQLGLVAGWKSIGSNVLIGIARPRGGGVRSFSSRMSGMVDRSSKIRKWRR